jgi:bifunctional phosphoserine phosphatase/homoserine phosphotransferase/precorrin-6x reductase
VILLLGGTGETAAAAEGLARSGYRVLVSTATAIPLAVGAHPRIAHRAGRLGEAEMAALIRERGIRAIVDVTHPYAAEARRTAARAAEACGIQYLAYLRPRGVRADDGVRLAEDHATAARMACEAGKPILLTIGSTHVGPYAAAARQAGIPLIARVLDDDRAMAACLGAGMLRESVIAGRGPFSVEETRSLLRRFGIGVLVTKDGGGAGGVREKLAAAHLESCTVVVVQRPTAVAGACSTLPELLQRVQACVRPEPRPTPWVLALDLESVLVPEVWAAVARVAGVPELAVTTRDAADYEALMRRRIALCRQHHLPLSRLHAIVGSLEPLPGALAFLEWARASTLVVILSDTYHELAWPVAAKLGCPLMVCNGLALDEAGYIADIALRPGGKAGAVGRFQGLGFRVAAVGDSHNDVGMLRAADAGILFRPCPGVAGFPAVSSFEALRAELTRWLDPKE